MTRYLGIALCLSIVVLIGATLVGRAMDTEAQQHVLITRGDTTIDCVRHVSKSGETVHYEDGSTFVAKGGEVFYDGCDIVP